MQCIHTSTVLDQEVVVTISEFILSSTLAAMSASSMSASSTDRVNISESVPVLTEATRRQIRKAVDLPLRLFYKHQGLKTGSADVDFGMTDSRCPRLEMI